MKAFALAQTGVQTDFYLMLVGDGPHRPDLERLAVELGIRPWILFTGAVHTSRCRTMWPRWSGGDAELQLVRLADQDLRIRRDGPGGDRPGHAAVREVMRDEEEGLIIPAGSVEALQSALGRLAGHALLRKRLGDRFRERVLRQYTWTHAADRLLSICEDACRQGARRIGDRPEDASIPSPLAGIDTPASASGNPVDMKAGR